MNVPLLLPELVSPPPRLGAALAENACGAGDQCWGDMRTPCDEPGAAPIAPAPAMVVSLSDGGFDKRAGPPPALAPNGADDALGDLVDVGVKGAAAALSDEESASAPGGGATAKARETDHGAVVGMAGDAWDFTGEAKGRSPQGGEAPVKSLAMAAAGQRELLDTLSCENLPARVGLSVPASGVPESRPRHAPAIDPTGAPLIVAQRNDGNGNGNGNARRSSVRGELRENADGSATSGFDERHARDPKQTTRNERAGAKTRRPSASHDIHSCSRGICTRGTNAMLR
jgi:hypothetical protein